MAFPFSRIAVTNMTIDEVNLYEYSSMMTGTLFVLRVFRDSRYRGSAVAQHAHWSTFACINVGGTLVCAACAFSRAASFYLIMPSCFGRFACAETLRSKHARVLLPSVATRDFLPRISVCLSCISTSSRHESLAATNRRTKDVSTFSARGVARYDVCAINL